MKESILQKALSQELHTRNIEIKKLGKRNKDELQTFLNNFNDFFILCEGVKGSANGILSACPPSKNILQDKVCLGAYKADSLIGFLDIIKNYPSEKVMTIGYLLVLPSYRSLGVGGLLVNHVCPWAHQQGFINLRLGVQEQNPRALLFWQKSGFKIVETFNEKLGKKLNKTYVLERVIGP